jgi:hypothetical protein
LRVLETLYVWEELDMRLRFVAALCAVVLMGANKATAAEPLEITAKDGKVRVQGNVGGKNLCADAGSVKLDREKQALILIGTDKEPVSTVVTAADGTATDRLRAQTVIIFLANDQLKAEQVIAVSREWGPDIRLTAPKKP